MSQTLRMLLPQWQGGVNPDYVFGSEVLAFIAPPSKTDETVKVVVNEDFNTPLQTLNGVDGETALLAQLEETVRILELKSPDKIIVFGGDCSISQAPFDYLSGKYGEKLGVLWLDAHPDVSSPAETSHNHEMVLANIIGHGAPQFVTRMKYPVDTKRVMFGGLIKDELRDMDHAVHSLNIRIATPEELTESSQPIIEWIKENSITHLAVHWDLDVVSPEDFRGTYPAKPYQKKEDFGVAIGQMTLEQVVRIFGDVNDHAEIVGMCIAEHMPWDAINLRKALANISIFNTN